MPNGKDSRKNSSSSVLNVLQWVFLALAAEVYAANRNRYS